MVRRDGWKEGRQADCEVPSLTLGALKDARCPAVKASLGAL